MPSRKNKIRAPRAPMQYSVRAWSTNTKSWKMLARFVFPSDAKLFISEACAGRAVYEGVMVGLFYQNTRRETTKFAKPLRDPLTLEIIHPPKPAVADPLLLSETPVAPPSTVTPENAQ